MIVLAGIGAVVSAFVRIYAPLRRRNWDLDAALGKICNNHFPFPVLQLQADSDPMQPPSIFADLATKCPNVQIEWVTNASHFDNFDQPAQVAAAINRFLHASK